MVSRAMGDGGAHVALRLLVRSSRWIVFVEPGLTGGDLRSLAALLDRLYGGGCGRRG